MIVKFKDSCGQDVTITAAGNVLNDIAIMAGEASNRYGFMGMPSLVRWANSYQKAIDSVLKSKGYYDNIMKGEQAK